MKPEPLGPGPGFGTPADGGEAGADADGSPEGEGSDDGGVVTVPGGLACAPPPESGVAGAGGGLVTEIVPAEPLQVTPAASCTVSVGWNVPAA